MRLDRGGWALHYDVAGAGDETIVMTHGLASSGATWTALVDALARRYRVITWDLRSHGRSDSPDEPCTIAALGADLAAIVTASGGAPAHLLGHSAGGVVAMRCVIDHPELVRSMILVGTASECNARAVAYYESLAELAERDDGAAVVRRLGARDETAIPPEGRGFARVARAIATLHTAPLSAALEMVRRPALVVVGEKDFLGVGGSVIISRRVVGSRLEIVPERGHSIFREDPAGFERMILDFLGVQRAA